MSEEYIKKQYELIVEAGEYKLAGKDVTLSQRHNLTVQNLESAIIFYKNCHKIEENHNGDQLGKFFTEIRAYVIASVILSAATLEAYINEIFLNVHDGIINNIEESVISKFINEWESIEAKSTLDKYKFFLKYTNKHRNNKTNAYFYPDILMKIRNGLVHYKPKWDYEKTPEEELEHLFVHIKGKVNFSPFIEENAPFFPLRCMTHSFAKWTIETVLDFVKWFEDTAGIENKLERFRDQL